MAKYDLTHTVGGYLDRHLVFPLLEFVQEQQIYPDEEIMKAKLDLLQKTNMVDFATEIHKVLHNTEEVPEEMKEQRAAVVARLGELQEAAKKLVEFLSNPQLVSQLRPDKQWNLHFLREQYENFASPLNQLQQRTWLLHWSLFVFFNHDNGRNGIIDLFFADRYLNAIQTNAHHLLRYLAVAVLINKRKRNVLKDLVRVIQQEHFSYRDPVTDFVECLFVDYDFEGAQQKLRECDELLRNDFFLNGYREEFMENARLFVFETYCRIHQCIDIKMLAEKLDMDHESAERWVVNLIRNARLDAKIDSKAGTVIMGTTYPNIYEQIVEKTENLTFRTYSLAATLAQQRVA
eukprot:jgi/Chlat1/4022/Chrsp26S08844